MPRALGLLSSVRRGTLRILFTGLDDACMLHDAHARRAKMADFSPRLMQMEHRVLSLSISDGSNILVVDQACITDAWLRYLLLTQRVQVKAYCVLGSVSGLMQRHVGE